MSTTSTAKESAITLSEKLKVEWPVLLVMIGGLGYLASVLLDIRVLLVRLDARQNAMEQLIPVMQNQIIQQGDRMNSLGERVTRIEATQPK